MTSLDDVQEAVRLVIGALSAAFAVTRIRRMLQARRWRARVAGATRRVPSSGRLNAATVLAPIQAALRA